MHTLQAALRQPARLTVTYDRGVTIPSLIVPWHNIHIKNEMDGADHETRKDRPPAAQGQKAREAIKKHFPSLMNVVATEVVLAHLYAAGMVDDSTFDVVTSHNVALSNNQKGTAVLKSIQSTVQVKPDKFNKLCQILKSEGDHEELADELAGTSKA